MGLWDDITAPVLTVPMICSKPENAGRSFCGPITASAKQNLQMLEAELQGWEDSLDAAKYLQDFSKHAAKMEQLRAQISSVRSTIAKPLNYAAVYEDAKSLLSAVRSIGSIDPRVDQKGAARAYSKAMKSFGSLIQKLPPPANAVGTLIAEMGKIFQQIVANMQPEVHMREPGLRETIENL